MSVLYSYSSISNSLKIQGELDALRRALEAAGVRSVADPQKVAIEISHLIRRASMTNGETEIHVVSNIDNHYVYYELIRFELLM